MNDTELISRFRSSGQATLDSETASAIKKTLLTEFDWVTSVPVHPLSRWARFRQRPMFGTAVVLVALAVLLTGREVVNAARPGDLLYPLDLLQERINTTLRIREIRKVAYQAGVAEERFEEQVALENAGSDQAFTVENPRVEALNQALAAVKKAQANVAAKKGKASTALREVEDRLSALQAKAENRRLNIEVKYQTKQTRIRVNSRAHQWHWTTTTVDQDAVVKEIIDRTGLAEEQIRAFLPATGPVAVPPMPTPEPVVETPVVETPPATPPVTKPKPTPTPPQPAPSNKNTTVTAPEPVVQTPPEPATVIRVRVALKERKTRVHTEVGGKKSDWELKTTQVARILARLRAKTGLTNEEIIAIWDFEQR